MGRFVIVSPFSSYSILPLRNLRARPLRGYSFSSK